MMTKHFISYAKKQNLPQSYIVYLSSIVADIRNPFTTTFYQASKLSNKVFARLVYYPTSVNLSYVTIKPGWVSTNMTKNKEVGQLTATREEEVQAIMKSMGYIQGGETYA